MIEDGPVPAGHGVVRWRLVDLMQWLWVEYQVTISKRCCHVWMAPVWQCDC
jgi:hypothetical protein